MFYVSARFFDILCLFFVLYVASDRVEVFLFSVLSRRSEVVYVVQVVPRCFGLKMFNVCFVEMATTQEVELLRRQLEELDARMERIPQQSASAAMNAAVTGLTDAVRTMGQSVTRPRPEDTSRETRTVRAWQRL